VKEAFPFAHLLGMPQLKAHATEAAKRVASSRAITVARNVISPKAEKAVASAAAQVEASKLINPIATTASTASEIENINIAERRRGAEIMAAAIVSGSPQLGLALFESGIAAKRAINAIAAAKRDMSGHTAPQSAAATHPRNYVSSSTGRSI
jgi:hypothetical protein